MADIVTLGLALDAKGVLRARDSAVKALNSIDQSSRKTEKRMSALQKGFKRFAKTAAGLFGLSLLTRGLRGMVETIATGEQSAAKLESVLKATGFAAGRTASQIDALGRAMADTTLFNDDEIRNTAAVLATFKNVQDDVFDSALKSILDISQVLGQDLRGAAVQVGKALNDPIRGVSALSEVGVSFTQQQRDMIRTMTEAGDVAGAQGVILAELAGEFGGAAAGANVGLFGSITQTTKAWKDFVQVIGTTEAATKPAIGVLDFFRGGLSELAFIMDTSVNVEITKLQKRIEDLRLLLPLGRSRVRTRGGLLGLLGITRELTAAEIKDVEVQLGILQARLRFLQAETRRVPAGPEVTDDPNVAERKARLKQIQDDAREFNDAEKARAMAWQRSWGRAIENTQDSFARFFSGLLTSGVTDFKDFANRILQIWIDLSAQIAATKLFEAFLSTAIGTSLNKGGIPDLKDIPTELPSLSVVGAAPGGVVNLSQVINIPIVTPDSATVYQMLVDNQGAVAAAVRKAAQDAGGFGRLL